MSWIVQNLILNRTFIVSNTKDVDVEFYPQLYDFYYPDVLYTDEGVAAGAYATFDLENDEYNLLLKVEDKIIEMYKKNQLTEKEVEVLKLISAGYSYKEIAQKLDITKNSIKKIFNSTCNKVAFSLGGIFTDEGYVEYMIEKYELDEAQASKMITLMESNRRL